MTSLEISLSEEQREFRLTARRFLDHHCSLDVVRASSSGELGYPQQLWRDMASLGWLGLSVPAGLGGSGAPLVMSWILHAELGRALAPTPHAASALAVDLLVRHGSREQCSNLVPAILAGECLVVPAVQDPGVTFGRVPGYPRARPDGGGDGWRVSGEVTLVPFAAGADQVIVPVETRSEPGGATLLLVPVSPDAVRLESLPNVGRVPLFTLRFDDVRVDSTAVVGDIGRAQDLLEAPLERARLLRGAEIAGAGERLLELTVAYAQNREQFGRPIGSYQAVQYLCTDLAIDAELTSLLGLRAAWYEDHSPSPQLIALANRTADRAVFHMPRCAHEVFAGLGFMAEHDLHLFTRRLKHWQHDLRPADLLQRDVASLLGPSDEAPIFGS